MPSIISGFDTIQQALAAQQYALSITQRNVANATSPDYTRQDILFTPVGDWDGTEYGIPGVALRAIRDQFIDASVSRELQSLEEYTVASNALQQIDALILNGGHDLQQALSDFFNSFGELASTPEDSILRQQVLETANALVREFHRLYGGIQQVQTSEDRALSYAIQESNSITEQIADLNKKIQVAQGAQSEEVFTLRDSRQQKIEQLSKLIDLSYFETESGSLTVTTRQGKTLVIGDENCVLELAPLGNSFQGVFLEGVDITDSLESGKLGGLIDVRDNKIAGYLSALDDMAAAIIERVNELHAQGIDFNGAAGGDFFTPFTPAVPGSNEGAARSMSVALADPLQIAAGAVGYGVGNGDIAEQISGVGDELLFSSSTKTVFQFYSGLISRIGTDEKTAEDGITAQNGILNQLQNQRNSLSGVNLDEEAVHIIQFQKAYQASARFATVLEAMSDEILQLLGG
jgi:flagellar hook-associated protein 1 FlgK